MPFQLVELAGIPHVEAIVGLPKLMNERAPILLPHTKVLDVSMQPIVIDLIQWCFAGAQGRVDDCQLQWRGEWVDDQGGGLFVERDVGKAAVSMQGSDQESRFFY